MSSLNHNHYPCPRCKGHGELRLTGVYLETLELVRKRLKRGGFIVANRDAEHFGCNPTALNNRLNRLEQMKFLVSEEYGKQRRFKLPML